MTIREAIQEGIRLLERMETPFLDASLLLAFTLKITREKLLASYPDPLEERFRDDYLHLIYQRIEGNPVSYLIGKKEFYGRSFFVDLRVLVPRPDTEIIVDAALELIKKLKSGYEQKGLSLRLLDVCTGTGCIPLTIALETHGLEITASELSPGAGEVFRINSKELGNPGVKLVESNLMDDVEGQFEIITSNPPYLTEKETSGMMEKGWPEPAMALDGGKDGLDLIRKLIRQSREKLSENGYLLIEASSWQMGEIETIMKARGFEAIKVIQDLAGRERVIQGRYGGT